MLSKAGRVAEFREVIYLAWDCLKSVETRECCSDCEPLLALRLDIAPFSRIIVTSCLLVPPFCRPNLASLFFSSRAHYCLLVVGLMTIRRMLNEVGRASKQVYNCKKIWSNQSQNVSFISLKYSSPAGQLNQKFSVPVLDDCLCRFKTRNRSP